MKKRRDLPIVLVALVVMTSPLLAGKAGRWAGRGAAGGAILGLVVGGDLGSAAQGAALGAVAGGASGAISESRDRKREQQAELEELRRREAQQAAEARHQAEAKAGETPMPADLPQTEEEWVAAIGQDNVTALDALIDCQHDRARLLAQAAATVDDPEFRLVARWIEALVELDRKDQAAATRLYEQLIPLDDDVDTLQQAGLMADQAILEVRRVRQYEGVTCG